MKALTITELMTLSRNELIALGNLIRDALPRLPEGSDKRRNALVTLSNIRFILARRHRFVPR